MKISLVSVAQTENLAKKLACGLRGGEIIALSGNLGSGKTTFTQYLAKALGVRGRVISPTFVVLRLYDVKHRTIKNLVHIDAYRLESAGDLAAIGWYDFLNKRNVVVVEWADKVVDLLPPEAIWLRFRLGRLGGCRSVMIKNFPSSQA